jgi:hypothetical protein
MRHFMIITGILIALTFLLAMLVSSVRASGAAPPPAGDAQPADTPPTIYLALMGGAASLAVLVWWGMLRRVQNPALDRGTAQDSAQ